MFQKFGKITIKYVRYLVSIDILSAQIVTNGRFCASKYAKNVFAAGVVGETYSAPQVLRPRIKLRNPTLIDRI